MSTEKQEKSFLQDPRFKRAAIYAAALVVAFLLGLVPMWLTARSRASARDQALRELRLCRTQTFIATAALDTRRAEYERARQAASDFFTDLRAEIDRQEDKVLTDQQRGQLQPIMAQRDEVITLLARSDPAAADRLLSIYFDYLKVVRGA
ncbi:MAG TPA: hypothetical protein VJ715_03775 [Pyrinomonadaceae bacterium]|nr:hypothetical protein [Pyrinomonadaceae bacterium]